MVFLALRIRVARWRGVDTFGHFGGVVKQRSAELPPYRRIPCFVVADRGRYNRVLGLRDHADQSGECDERTITCESVRQITGRNTFSDGPALCNVSARLSM